jgi:thymidylate synthase
MNFNVNYADPQYLDNAELILLDGEEREERTGTGAVSLFSPPKMKFDLTKGFPLLTTKKLHIPSIVHELIWFLKGNTDIKYLRDNKIKIWDADAYRDFKDHVHLNATYEEFLEATKEGYGLGKIYGHQWRKFESKTHIVDQIRNLIHDLKHNPKSRRHIVTAWNPADLPYMALPPCHILFQAYVSNDGGLSLQMYQRSADWFLGVPFNIASYSLLTHMIAQVTGLYAKEFIHVIGDAHIYQNHIPQIKEQMQRTPKDLPTLKLNPNITDIDDFTAEDIEFIGYDPHPLIKGTVSVG